MTTQSIETKRELLLVKRNSGVALIMFDAAGKYNSMGSTTIRELSAILEAVTKDESIKAIVGISGKPESFIIGADLHEIRKAGSYEEVLKLSSDGQALLNRISTFKKPFIAAINGTCLGGGLELALSTHYRIASQSERTVLGLPETRLGLIPGAGGTQRLPRLVGLKKALDMILGAEPIKAQEALDAGLVDEIVDPDELIARAEQRALEMTDCPRWQEKRLKNEQELLSQAASADFCLPDLTPEKAEKMIQISERAVKLRSKGNYPAQSEVLKVIRTGLKEGMASGLKLESETFARLARGDVSSNLISLYFNTDLARSSAQSLVNKFPGSRTETLGVIGAGTMGSSIALIAAANGIKTILKTSALRQNEVKESLHHSAQRVTHQKGYTAETALEKITVSCDENDLSSADLILECIVEDERSKAQVLKNLNEKLKHDAVTASNTSALSIEALSTATAKPENFLGVHFFHPVDKMPLVELIPHAGTSKQALARATDLILKLDKIPLLVKDKPGFLINRLLTVYLFELARLAQEKVPINWVEESMLDFGMPMGPLQLMDEIGIDVAFTVAKNLEEGLGERMRSPEIFKRVCAMGLQGKRSNVGFYLWEAQEKKLGINPDMLEKTGAVVSSEKCPEDEKHRIIERMIFAMIDESARCLEERIVARPREIDFALVLGVGFPAFRGGLLKYADLCGLARVSGKLEEIYAASASCGSAGQRRVSAMLKKYAEDGRGFYSLSASKED